MLRVSICCTGLRYCVLWCWVWIDCTVVIYCILCCFVLCVWICFTELRYCVFGNIVTVDWLYCAQVICVGGCCHCGLVSLLFGSVFFVLLCLLVVQE